MKKLTRKTLDELAKILPVVSIEEQQECWGGQMDSCVFNCFDHLDGSRRTAVDYYVDTLTNLSLVPNDNGGIPFSAIGEIGSYGGFNVHELPTDSIINKDGTTEDGSHIMIVFERGDIGHAVVVTGTGKNENGDTVLHYFDPTSKETGKRVLNDYSAIFSVKEKPTPPSGGTTGSSGGSTSS